jgi:hypothetical protein
VRHLDNNGFAGTTLVNGFANWLHERGYAGEILGAQVAPDELITEASDPELLLLAGMGNIYALHELAERSVRDGQNPLEAIEWYDQAIVNGSLYAMLRRADLLNTLSDPALAGFLPSGEWSPELKRITDDRATGLQEALGWALSAYIVGGYATMNSAQATRLQALSDELEQLNPYAIDLACNAAQDFVLDIASSRRARGGAVFSTLPPPFAVTVADPAAHDPCGIEIVPLVALEHCNFFEFVNPRPNRLMRAWVCP